MKEWKLNKLATLLIFLMTAVLMSSCLSEDQVPGPAANFGTELLVETGYTYGEIIEGETSTFTLSWMSLPEAEWYDVRIYPVPINEDNWDDAVRIDSVIAQDTSVMIVHLEVQPEVFQNTCISCGQCVEVCPQNAMSLVGGKAVIDLDLCTACGECVAVCPVNAISDSRYGQAYYFGIKAMTSGNVPTDLVTADGSYRLRYANDDLWCGDCAYECFILLDSCGPGCPVDAIWYEPSGRDSGLVHIDYDKCIDCGQCWIQCHEYGLWSIKREVVAE